MASLQWILGSLVAWFGVWALSLSLTWKFHPTFGLAIIVTTSLIAAYANIVSLDHLRPASRPVAKRQTTSLCGITGVCDGFPDGLGTLHDSIRLHHDLGTGSGPQRSL